MSLAHSIATALAAELGGGVRKSGKGWTVRCCCHPDRSPSLSLADGKDVPVIVHCWGGCRSEDVLADLVGRGLLPDYREEKRNGRRQLVTHAQVQFAKTALAIWDNDRKRGLSVTPEDEAARKAARRVLALAKKFPPSRTPTPWMIRLAGSEVRIDVGERLRGLPEARYEPLSVHWPPEIEAALLIDQGASQEVLERLVRQCLRAGARVVRVVSGGRMDVHRGEVCHAAA